MSFFDFGNEQENNGNFEAGSGDFSPIPKGTVVNVIAEEVKWKEFNSDPEFVEVKWSIVDGEYKGRKIFQKIHTQSSDPQKATKAQRMLGAINFNAKGGLEKLSHKPTDAELTNALTFKKMALKLEVWISKEDFQTGQALPEAEWKSGNWVAAVSPVGSVQQPNAQPVATNVHEDDGLPF